MPWNEADRVKYDVIRERYSSDLSDEESAGSGCLNSLPRKISGVLPGLMVCGIARCHPFQAVLDRAARHPQKSPDLPRAHSIVVKPQ